MEGGGWVVPVVHCTVCMEVTRVKHGANLQTCVTRGTVRMEDRHSDGCEEV